MANAYHTITIDLTLDRSTTKDVLHGVLHSILFHRLFGTIKPTTFEVLDVTLPGVVDPEMERLVKDKVDGFWRGVDNGRRRGQIVVTFSQKVEKKSWFTVGEELVPWEQWVINVDIRQRNDNDFHTFQASLANTLTKALQTMITHTSSERGRSAVPLITNATGISPFPIDIAVN
ncbi:DUF1649-domain-containing protein [Coprinopsis marcescibilis]|uniref:Autophagy-related protein 101 n=1 Tax=Coprinopsis marcescibilis TaxID=230819 RepID=A0A5C3KHW6_COPMA|nr:DUF1649-domain-containing protein [Coprinopsis marcescibilis]